MPPPFDIGIGAVCSFKPRGKGKTDCGARNGMKRGRVR